MLYSVDHSVGIARDLADRLSLRFSNSSTINTIAQSQDENGYPIIIASHNGVATESNPVVWIRLMNIDVGAKDIFGNSTLPFTPTLAQVAYELNGAGAPIPSTADFSTCLFEIARTGCVVSEYAIANGTAVTEAAVNAASPVQTIKDLDWGFKGNT
jgi:hypothetical protein